MGKFLQLHQKNGNGRTSYQFRHVKLDELLGDWNENICHWWSYAAGFGDYIAIGPFLSLPGFKFAGIRGNDLRP